MSVDKNTDTFLLSIFVDGKQVYHNDYESYEEVLEILTDTYMFLPDEGTSDYDNLLTEARNEWQLINPTNVSQPASSKTNKEKFAELTDFMSIHKGSLVTKAEVVRLDDNGFTYKEHWHSPSGQDYIFTLLVGHSRFNSSWKYELYMDTSLIKEVKGSGWEDLIEELEKYFHVPKAGSPEYRSLTESLSIADEFKLFENLF